MATEYLHLMAVVAKPETPLPQKVRLLDLISRLTLYMTKGEHALFTCIQDVRRQLQRFTVRFPT